MKTAYFTLGKGTVEQDPVCVVNNDNKCVKNRPEYQCKR